VGSNRRLFSVELTGKPVLCQRTSDDYVQDQARVTFQQLERLQPQLRYAQAEDTITKAKQHHDAYCEPVAEQSLRWCQVWKAFLEASAALVSLIDEQVSPLVVLTRADGQPMFELAGGAVTLERMLNVVPGQPGFLVHSVMPVLREDEQINVGQSRTILSHVQGREPFENTNVERYLAGFQYDEPKPDMFMEEL
jgi:hypothetical protein